MANNEAYNFIYTLKYIGSLVKDNPMLLNQVKSLASFIRQKYNIAEDDQELGVDATIPDSFLKQIKTGDIKIYDVLRDVNDLILTSKDIDMLSTWTKFLNTLKDTKVSLPQSQTPQKKENYTQSLISGMLSEINAPSPTGVQVPTTPSPTGNPVVTSTGQVSTGTSAQTTNITDPSKWIVKFASKYGVDVYWDNNSKQVIIDAKNPSIKLDSGDSTWAFKPSSKDELQQMGLVLGKDNRLYVVDENKFESFMQNNLKINFKKTDDGIVRLDIPPAPQDKADSWIRNLVSSDTTVGWTPDEKGAFGSLYLEKGDKAIKIDKSQLADWGLSLDSKGYVYVSNNDLFDQKYKDTFGVSPTEVETTIDPFAGMDDEDLVLMQKKIDTMFRIDNYNQLKTQVDEFYGDPEKQTGIIGDIIRTYDSLITSSIDRLEKALKESVDILEKNKGNMDEYAEIRKNEIDKAVRSAKESSKADMVARGIYFSGLTSRALARVEAQGISEKAKVDAEVMKYKAEIDAQIAVLTANTKMSEAQLANTLEAQKALEVLKMIETKKEKLFEIDQMIKGLDMELQIQEQQLPYVKEANRRLQEAKSAEELKGLVKDVIVPMMNLVLENKKYNLSVQEFMFDTYKFLSTLQLDYEKLGLDKQQFIRDTALELAKMYGFSLADAEKALNGWLGQIDTSKYQAPVTSSSGSGGGSGSGSSSTSTSNQYNFAEFLDPSKGLGRLKTEYDKIQKKLQEGGTLDNYEQAIVGLYTILADPDLARRSNTAEGLSAIMEKLAPALKIGGVDVGARVVQRMIQNSHLSSEQGLALLFSTVLYPNGGLASVFDEYMKQSSKYKEIRNTFIKWATIIFGSRDSKGNPYDFGGFFDVALKIQGKNLWNYPASTQTNQSP